ncbi:hypothetical protein V5O48_009363 [Marasmius crinis-equi]|uniref:Inositol hexakisphosphate-domain-containing protein n=1 Tax=Marasmius crinis-equi TaxID=585013 RepID=A0ABR3FBF3_9AGAR
MDDLQTSLRSVSVPPLASDDSQLGRDSSRSSIRMLHKNKSDQHARPASVAPHKSHRREMSTDTKNSGVSLDLMGYLQRAGPSVVKTRSGSVLTRGFILKTDFYPTGRALDLELNVHGAPNFRAPKKGDLNVFGVAQPRTQGLRAILSVLRCRPGIQDPSHVVWFSTREEPIVYISGRPFVLRDAAQPKRMLSLSDRAENLEAIEMRLKNDILQEATKYGGLVLTHNEMASDSGEGAILPTWTAVDTNNVRTQRELWTYMKKEGWNVDYYRIPISPDRPIEDNYLDAYLNVILETDPLKTSLVFSCGMGAVRTTYAMVAACIVRRKKVMELGGADPFELTDGSSAFNPSSLISGANTPAARSDTPLGGRSGAMTPSNTQMQMALDQAYAQQDLSRSLLKMTYLLQQTLPESASLSAIELLMSNPTLLENLRKAHIGNYGIILSLLGCCEKGVQAKKLVDKVIDANDHVLNLREDILISRIQYSLTSMDGQRGQALLNSAGKALEKYFFIIAFASYVETSVDFSQSFSDWLKTRTEIWNQVKFLRKSISGHRLSVFAPANDLSILSRRGSEGRALVPGKKNDVAISGGQIYGDEYSTHVIKNRSGIILREGTLLKSDQWLRESHHVDNGVRGAINFRRNPNTNIYALGQPTLEAIDEVVRRVKEEHPHARRVVWVTLREEPIVYVNGAPYCLRREGFSLRNMKDYGGISSSRLEVLEERLREDIISELTTFGGRLLLHTETEDGTVIPVWEDVESRNVVVLKDIMESRRDTYGVELIYDRIPITAEHPPDSNDLSELIDLVLRSSFDTPIVVNCQLGRGRNLLRVVRAGLKIKNDVDATIDQCAMVYNLRDSIEESRLQAEEATDKQTRKKHVARALQNLRRYFELIIFGAYLHSTEPSTMKEFESIESFVKKRPVLKTFQKELTNVEGLDVLKPLERVDVMEGVAHPDEVKQVVANRSGTILSASTILKSDFFSNLQKMTLPERIEGSPNFRRVPLTLKLVSSGRSTPTTETDFVVNTVGDGKMVCGSGMPTVDGLRRALRRVDAGPDGNNFVYWTSLREEPVIYVAGRPHVLRLVDKPLENVEATGVTTAVVEAMERSFKKDVLHELRRGQGRMLLHDEVEERPGVFSIIPIWETVKEEDILTPSDVFELMAKEGYKINYGRVAITDEQAPLPEALAILLERVQSGLSRAGDFIFNCQMGRGRTTTGMVTACLISTTMNWDTHKNDSNVLPDTEDKGDISEEFNSMDGPSEEEAYRQGKLSFSFAGLILVGVLSHGKVAKRLTDRAIDLMQDVQNLRKAIYELVSLFWVPKTDNADISHSYKLKVEACEKGSKKEMQLRNITVNYLYRYGTLIVFANYLIEMRERGEEIRFPTWLEEHREITKLLGRRSLD